MRALLVILHAFAMPPGVCDVGVWASACVRVWVHGCLCVRAHVCACTYHLDYPRTGMLSRKKVYPASLRWPATLWLTESWPSTTAPALTPRREGLDGAVDTEWVGCCVHAFGCLCSSVCMRLSACCVPALCMLGPCACLVSANFMLWRFITLLYSSGWNIRSIHAGCGSTCVRLQL